MKYKIINGRKKKEENNDVFSDFVDSMNDDYVDDSNPEYSEVIRSVNGKDEIIYTMFIDDIYTVRETNESFRLLSKDEYLQYNPKNAEQHSLINIYLHNEIFPPQYYTFLTQMIMNSTQGDIIVIHLNSIGGDFNTVCALGNAVVHSKAFIITKAEGEVHSAAFCILCMGNDIQCDPFSTMMCHNICYETESTDAGHLKKAMDANLVRYEKILKGFCSKILTEEEINSILKDGHEYYFTSDEIEQRIELNSLDRNNTNEVTIPETTLQ